MEVRELVGGSAQMCESSTTIAEAAAAMIAAGVGSLGVPGPTGLAGIVTERDVLRAVASGVDLGVDRVTDWMTHDPDTVDEDLSVDEAAEWMVAAGYRHLPVLSGGQLIGIASIKDVLWGVTEYRARLQAENRTDD